MSIKDSIFRVLTLNRVVNKDPDLKRIISIVEDLTIDDTIYQVADLSPADLIRWFDENVTHTKSLSDLANFVHLVSICRRRLQEDGWLSSNEINFN